MNKIINTILFVSLIAIGNASSIKTAVANSLVLDRTCINQTAGYRIKYPQGWKTNSGEVVNLCRVFDPRSAQVPEYTETTGKAIYLRIENNVSFDEIAKEDISERHLSSKTIDVAGNQAVVIESESTGKALLRKGIRKYNYIVDLGDKTLIATTFNTAGNDYRQNKQILDQMMTTIELDR